MCLFQKSVEKKQVNNHNMAMIAQKHADFYIISEILKPGKTTAILMEGGWLFWQSVYTGLEK